MGAFLLIAVSLWMTWSVSTSAQGTQFAAILSADSTPNVTGSSTKPVVSVAADSDEGLNIIPNVLDPEAVSAQTVCSGYTASNVRDTSNGFQANLDLAGTGCRLYGNDIEHLILTVSYEDSTRLGVVIEPRYIGPENATWFLLPEALVPQPTKEPDATAESSELEFSWSNDPTFSFTVVRKKTGDVLFTTKGSVLVFADQFIEFVSPLPENYNLYGLGEVMYPFRQGQNTTRTLFNADVGDVYEANIYGTHPIYLDTRYFVKNENGSLVYAPSATDTSANYTSFTHGVFLRNAHAQDILLRPSGITWRAIGGSIDLHFYSGPTAQDVIKSYHLTTVGLPAMHQYWTLGFHQCRWGYQNWTVLQDVVDNFAKFQIPLETIWTDIDYMNQYRDFDNDAVRFGYAEGAEFIERLRANHQHYIPIVDSAIYVPNANNASDAYPTYDRGVAANAFMLNPDGSTYIGSVWPGYTVFPDWIGAVLNGTGTIDWWANELRIWHEKISFDGIWIDMSEVSSFCVGSCGSANVSMNPVHPPFQLPGEPGNLEYHYPEGFDITNATEAASASSAAYAQAHASTTVGALDTTTSSPYYRTTPTPGARNINWPPYAINHINRDLAVHAVSPNATHHGGSQEYDFHNLFGYQILNATYHALLGVFPDKRPFIIGRSTFAGTGRIAGHWGGDNDATWAQMALSIPQALSFSIFGVPMFGVDTCGFGGNSDEELCNRWMQLSAFFPFYRNHNAISGASQEPYIWASVAEASKVAMRIRYSLLPYMYTLFALAHHDGSTVMRALTWEFPNEPWLAGVDQQFLLGNALMVAPSLTQGASTVDAIFPGAGDGTLWYDWYEQSAVSGAKAGENITLQAPLGHIPLFLRGGVVIPIQEAGMTTAESRNGSWALLVPLDSQGTASGVLYLDDGESVQPSETTWVNFQATATSLDVKSEGNYVDRNSLANVTVMGLIKAPGSISLNDKALASTYWSHNATSATLALVNLQDLFPQGAWSSNWTLSWS